MFREIREYWQFHGGAYTLRRGADKTIQRLLGTQQRAWERQRPTEAELSAQRASQPAGGLISVVIPVYNTRPALLEALLDTLRAQTYADWEALLYDGASDRAETLAVLERAAASDPRFRVLRGEVNRGISGNTNAALPHVRGEYTALCDHDDLLSPEALWQMAAVIAESAPDMLYSDEDRVTESGLRHMDPHWKPDYCPVSLLTANYICHLAVLRTSLLRELGGLRSGFDGSQDHDLFLRVAERTDRIAHIPRTLYSWREVGSSMSHQNLQRCLDNGCRAVMEHEARMGYPVTAVPVHKEIRLWYDLPRNFRIEALIFGDSEDACQAGWEELLFQTGAPYITAAFLVTDPEHLYESLNEAAASSTADYLLLLDADARGMNRHFLRELLMYAQRREVAGVTGALVDARRRLTHGGYALGMEGAAQCVNEGLFVTAGGWHDTMNRAHNVAAVSPCCMLVRREAWLPFDPAFRSGLGAVDLALRQREAGRWFVFTPHATAELSRRPMLLSGLERDAADLARLRERHGEVLTDPCYSPRFSRRRADYRA